jgi:predicted regulator of Ras-like GTPase activity (Roadblock/LC7/MglB family)
LAKLVFDKAADAAVKAALTHALARADQVMFFCLGHVDGRALTVVSRHPDKKANSIAAMSSSLLALSETFAKEAISSSAAYSLVSAAQGCLVAVRVPCAANCYVLSLGTDGSESIAAALRTALDSANAIARLLP